MFRHVQSVCPHVTAELQLDGFSRNLYIWGTYVKTCGEECQIWLKPDKNIGYYFVPLYGLL